MSNHDGQNDATSVNPASEAKQHQATPMPHIDYLVTGPNGQRKISTGAHFREEVKAVNLGNAAGQLIFGEALAGEVRESLSKHHSFEARLEAADPRRIECEDDYGAAADTVRALARVPLNGVAPSRRRTVNIVKVLLLAGDTCVLANQAYRASTPIWLALPLGLSLAASVVAIGSKCGHEIATSEQRRARGRALDNTPGVVRPFYDVDHAAEQISLWQKLSIAAAIIMFFALYLLGTGSGDPALLSMGYGLLGALTVAGSAALEASAANDAAEQLERALHRRRDAANELREFESMEGHAAESASDATMLEVASLHRAHAVTSTVINTTERLTDTPEVGGYLDGGHVPVLKEVAAPETVHRISIVHYPQRSTRIRRRAAQSSSTEDDETIDETHPSPSVQLGPPRSRSHSRPTPESTTSSTVETHDGSSLESSKKAK